MFPSLQLIKLLTIAELSAVSYLAGLENKATYLTVNSMSFLMIVQLLGSTVRKELLS